MSAPRHKQLTRSLREDITSGRFKVGDRLPPEVEFAVQCGVSRTTLRRALSELESEGLVARRKRVGTIVTAHSPQQYFQMRTNSVTELMRVTHEAVLEIWSSRMIDGGSEPLLHGRSSAGGRWLEVEGVRRMSGRLRPFSWNRMFVAEPYAGIEPSLSRHRLSSVVALIEEIYDRPVLRIVQDIRATACPPIAADAIGVSALGPVLCVETEFLSHDDEVIQISRAIYDPIRFQLRNEVLLD